MGQKNEHEELKLRAPHDLSLMPFYFPLFY